MRILKQSARFFTVGFTGMIVDMLVLWFLRVRLRIDVHCGKCVAAEIAVLNNFTWNELWTFAGDRTSQHRILRRLTRFHIISGSGILISLCLVLVLVRNFNAGILAANSIAIALVGLWNFTLAKKWAWGRAAAINQGSGAFAVDP